MGDEIGYDPRRTRNISLRDDHVYMEDKHLLEEYVVNDVGKIWVGPYGTSRGREWVFGQFDDCVLPACMVMLDRAAGAGTLKRSDPVAVTRAISRIVNSNDEDVSVAGVLHGRWDGDYKDGTAPAAWTGSVAILEEYLTTGKEVKYGQCWVFAGVVTTVCRALGIPSRVVSNLVSAHDANSSLTVDRYYDLNNEELDYDPTNWEGEDSIWNYHVWNDVWMARPDLPLGYGGWQAIDATPQETSLVGRAGPDLPLGYGGWQAIDATPQETSLGFFQCGPASLEAIKCGAVGFSYDVPFLLASVNADLFRWKEDPESDRGYTKISSNKYHIGRVIFTKAPWLFDPNGDKDREDITNQYKAEEGELVQTSKNDYVHTRRMHSLHFHINVERVLSSNILIPNKLGYCEPDDLNDNKSNSVKTVKAILSAASVYYTGIKAHLIKKASGDFQVQPKSIYCKPDALYCVKPASVAKRVKLQSRMVWFASNGEFGALIPAGDIRAGELVVLEHRFTPMRAGAQKLVATFSSTELLDITGAASIDVYDDTEDLSSGERKSPEGGQGWSGGGKQPHVSTTMPGMVLRRMLLLLSKWRIEMDDILLGMQHGVLFSMEAIIASRPWCRHSPSLEIVESAACVFSSPRILPGSGAETQHPHTGGEAGEPKRHELGHVDLNPSPFTLRQLLLRGGHRNGLVGTVRQSVQPLDPHSHIYHRI
uniref:Transglutaminase-like domain-containing protein n=1 Tax=Timema bartmani TaxID=61472 RepID=A0A7R9EWQ8_9NEOP|nr:unnamed protein product [Timema bartmani]